MAKPIPPNSPVSKPLDTVIAPRPKPERGESKSKYWARAMKELMPSDRPIGS